jgi:hypothetical protein
VPGEPPREAPATPWARACAGAVASHYLAVGTPRSFGIVGELADGAELSLVAHAIWFAPTDVRCTAAPVAEATRGRACALAEVLACDIVCIHVPLALVAAQLRRGTHVNALAAVTLDDDLARVAVITRERAGLPALAAGLVDGRQLDELTIFLLDDAALAAGAL